MGAGDLNASGAGAAPGGRGDPRPLLLAVPNISEGRDGVAIDAIAAAFGPGVCDVHRDPDHHRSVVTLAARQGALAGDVLAGARETVSRLTLARHDGIHPRVGVLDVAPIAYLDPARRGAACAEALVVADRLAEELGLPVFLYGELAGGRSRAELRRGGPTELARRLSVGELRPDFGPAELHPTAGAVLVAARPPLVAFNVELEPPAGEAEARRIAALIRESGPEGLRGLRAIGVWLENEQRAQVSTNVEDPGATPLARVVAAVARHATVAGTELVGLAPAVAFAGFPEDVPVRNRRVLEDVLPIAPTG